ncbi:MAG: hypothetical protein ACM3JH_05915 [Acidithiobacillales bacterium]
MTIYWTLLLPTTPADKPFRIVSYGNALRANKRQLRNAFEVSRIGDERRALMMAMAMIETTTLTPSLRDADKDRRTDRAANASIFNLNEDLLRQLGYEGDIHLLDPLSALPDVVTLISKGVDTWGVTRLLNFVRGGRTAFNDGVSFGAADYRNAVATGLRNIDRYPSLMWDDRRVEMNVPHMG